MEVNGHDIDFYNNLHQMNDLSGTFPPGYMFRLRISAAFIGQSDCEWFRHLECVYISPTWDKLSKIPRQDVVQDIWRALERIERNDAILFFDEFYRCLMSLSLLNREFRYHTSSGVHWMQVSMQPNADGEYIYCDGFALDITDKKNLDEHLAAQMNGLESLANNLPNGSLFSAEVDDDALHRLTDLLMVYDLLRMTYVSKSWGKVSGTKRSDAIASMGQVMAKVYPDDQRALAQSIHRALMSRGAMDMEVRYCVSELLIRWIRISVDARDENGKLVLSGLVIDVTDRKLIERELAEEKRTIESLSNNMPDGALHRLEYNTVTEQYRAVYLSTNWERLTGERRTDALNDVNRLFATIHPNDLPRLIELQQESIRTMTDLHCELRLKNHSPHRWVRIDAHPHREGILIIWDGFMMDISGYKRVEISLLHEKNRLESLSNNLHSGCLVRCTIDAHELEQEHDPLQLLGYLRMSYLSASWEKVVNVPRIDAMRSIMPFLTRLYADDRKSLIANLIRIVTLRQALDMEIRYRWSDTEVRWFRFTLQARIEEEQVVCDGFMLDISRRKEYEIEMAVYRDELELMVKMRTDDYETVNEELTATNEELGQRNTQLQHEINVRNELLQKLSDSEEQMRGFIEQSFEGILIFDMDGRIIEWNPAMERLSGLQRSEVLGKFEWDVRYLLEPDHKRVEGALEDIHRKRLEFMQGDSIPETREMTLYLSDGTIRYTRASLFQIRSGARKYFGRIVRDITKQREVDLELARHRTNLEQMVRDRTRELAESRERIVSLSNNIPGGVIYQMQDRRDGEPAKFTYVSTGFDSLFGVSSQLLLKDAQCFFSMLHPDDAYEFATFFETAPDEGTIDSEVRLLLNAGEMRWIHMRTGYRTNAEGIRLWDGFLIDITDRKKETIELRESHRRQDIFTRVLQIMQVAEDTPKAIAESVVEIGQYAGASRSYIFEKSLDGMTVSNTYEWCAPGVPSHREYNQDVPVGMIDWFEIFERGGRICTSDIATLSPRSRRMLSTQGVRSILVLPLTENGIIYGYAGFDDCVHYREFTEKDMELFTGLAQIMTSTVRRYRADMATQLSRRVMRKVLDSLCVSVFTVDFDTKEVLFANKEAREVWGRIEGEKCWKAISKIQEEPCNFCPQSKLFDAEGQPVGVYRWEFWSDRLKGWFECVDTAVEWVDGRMVHLEYTLDITDRKKIENELLLERNRLRSIGDHIPDGLLFRYQIDCAMLSSSDEHSFSNHLRLVYTSASWESITNIPAATAMRNVNIFLSKVDINDSVRFVAGFYHSLVEHTEFNIEVRYNFTDTEQHWLHIAAVPNVEDEQIIFDGFIFDITERKHAEAELVHTKLRAEESDRLKSAFLANMSHEILTPLNGIAGLLNTMNPLQLPEDMRENIADINRNSDHLISLISEVLDASRIETGQMIIKSEPVDVDTFMSEMHVYLQQILLKEGKQHITPEYAPDVASAGVTIHTDPTRLRQILCRLLGNAVKFTENGCIRLGWQQLEPNRIEFFVEDTGIGIPSSHVNALFRPFRQLEEGYSRRYGGMGLGLSISRGLTRLMGGDMSAISTEGKGSRFVFTIAGSLSPIDRHQ